MTTRRARSASGFTLIELMTVIAIIGILTAVLATTSGTGVGTPRTTADRITGMVQFARLRAEARRTIHLVRFQSNIVSIWEATTPGFNQSPTFPTDYIQAADIPSGVLVHSASTTVHTTTGNTPTLNANLPFDVYIRPDGSSTGGTIFLSDSDVGATDRFRILIYKVTGTALSREQW